jgi:hypothetical protein
VKNEEIFKKAIKKAVDNGWTEGEPFLRNISFDVIDWHKAIFSHYFAKAFWKTDKDESHYEAIFSETIKHQGGTWQYHLQQMVLEEEPIKYLEKFL